jgi:predicted ester cyclase
MSSTALTQLQQHYDNLMHGDLDREVEIFAADVETVTPNGTLKGIDEFRGLGEAFQNAMSGMRHDIVRVFEVGDTVIAEAVFSGVHTGPMDGPGGAIPASGNAVAFPYADFLTFKDGRCVSHRIYWDNVALLAQLGVTQ